MGAGYFVRRLTAAMIGMILLCAFLYLSLGWAVWSHQGWLLNLLSRYDPNGEPFIHLWEMYDEAAARMLPNDRDGDGVCDGYEIFRQEDPHNSSQHSELDGRWKTDGFVVFVREYPLGAAFPIDGMEKALWPSSDETMELRGRILQNSFVTTFPAGFKLRVPNPPGFLIATPGSKLEAKEVIIPVAHDGSIAFDLRASPDAAHPASGITNLALYNAPTGEMIIQCRLNRRWDSPSLTPNVNGTHPTTNPADFEYHLDWQMVDPGAEAVVIEAARDQGGASWHRIAHLPPETTSCRVYQFRDGPTVGGYWPVSYIGPLKFRIVPVRFSKP